MTIKYLKQLFLDGTRRSLEVLALWICLVLPSALVVVVPNVDTARTRLLWLLTAFPVFYLVTAMLKQHYDNQLIK